ncbi:GAF and ANTAR domain-containing protein [Geodermatophilus sabuli]|uniref:GAF and ANTAR domain-containing protein n=1 Tax=Geodermatophilus sabuli TaxID=1564158 RepID=A0A7K3VYE9_9ACTN|nr:GAF and ANTAR domain-containing protein [Geodermatophilus sabuli]
MTTLGSKQSQDDADLLAALASGGDLKTFLADLVELAAKSTPRAAACGLTMARSSGPVTVTATDALAQQADEGQYELDDGPCLEAMREGVVVRVEDMTRETRWGVYPARAADAGVRSSLSLPLVVEGRSRGALNLYATEPGAFGPDDETTGTNWAGHASGALGVALRIADSDERADALQGGLDTRTTIGQAVGLLMAQERCTAEQAFTLLRLSSQRRNVKLRDVATSVVTTFEAGLPDGPARW